MSEQTRAHDFVYVDTDIPEGMTIREWRAQRAARREEERAARRRRLRAAVTRSSRSHMREPSREAVLRSSVDRPAVAAVRLAIRGRGYARSAAPQANVPCEHMFVPNDD